LTMFEQIPLNTLLPQIHGPQKRGRIGSPAESLQLQ
jgi:hypothetical protein